MKRCAACDEVKALDEFGPDKRMKSGRRSYCRPCVAAKKRERDSRKPERIAYVNAAVRRLREGLKLCRKCAAEKPFDDFARCAESPDGLDPRCKPCKNLDAREFYARNLERERARSREASRVRWASQPEQMVAYSSEWRAANRDQIRAARLARIEADPTHERDKWLRRRARKAGATVGQVDLEALWNGTCGLCGDPLVRSLAWPHPLSASVDHIVPLARGGTHEQTNLQWAHLFCNLSKGARDVGEVS